MPRTKSQPPSEPRLYWVCANEQPRRNWAVFREIKAPKPLPRLEFIPSALFGTSHGIGGVFQTRPRYSQVVCSRCQRFDSDKIFEAGFDEDVVVRFRDDFALTNDRIFLISQRMLEVLRKGRVGGFEVKPVGTQGWHAMNVTLRVDSDPSAYHEAGTKCQGCGMRKEGAGGGIISRLSQVTAPGQSNVFFTSKVAFHGREISDRDFLCTEDVVGLLKENGIRKGSFHRLWTDQEMKTFDQKRAQGIDKWYPPKRIIYLS
jgi:hypothetical protein